MTATRPNFLQRLFGGSETSSDRRQQQRLSPSPDTRVLIIDDSRTIVAVLGKMLTQGGYSVVSAGDAETGIQMALAQPPDLIFLDIVLPGMNGFAALRVLRREATTSKTPIIMMSGNMQATEQFYAQKHGANDFLKKPFPRAELFHRIERLLAADRLPQAAQRAPAQATEVVADDATPAPNPMPPATQAQAEIVADGPNDSTAMPLR